MSVYLTIFLSILSCLQFALASKSTYHSGKERYSPSLSDEKALIELTDMILRCDDINEMPQYLSGFSQTKF